MSKRKFLSYAALVPLIAFFVFSAGSCVSDRTSDNGTETSAPGQTAETTETAETAPTSEATESVPDETETEETTLPILKRPDLIVTSVRWIPENPQAGDEVTFIATVENQGNEATPEGVIIGVLFTVDNIPTVWSDTSTEPLHPGETRELTSNGGPLEKATWTAMSGSFPIMAYVDDINRMPELDEGNNTMLLTLEVTGSGQSADATPVPSATRTVTSVKPLVYEEFEPWEGINSPDGIWRINGDWIATGQNLMKVSNTILTSTYEGDEGSGYLLLRTEADGTLNAGEIQTMEKYGYGYYSVRMKVAAVGDPTTNTGVCASFFIADYDGPGGPEIDIEFLTNESWITSENRGRIWFSVHSMETSINAPVDLWFNPSKDFHEYGFLWQPGRVDFTVDGIIVHTFENEILDNPNPSYIMMNNWTGTPNWGGYPPAEDAVTVYDWVKYYPDVDYIIY